MICSKVFLSHSHKDKQIYDHLTVELDRAGIDRWDLSSLGLEKPIAEGLRVAIETCDLCVFVATENSIESSWCSAELGAFWGAGKKVILFLPDPKVNRRKLPPQLRGNPWTPHQSELIEKIRDLTPGPVCKTPVGYRTKLGTMSIEVAFGRIEELGDPSPSTLIALPANEYFDVECLTDNDSALGAFMNHHFKNCVPEIQSLVRGELQGEVTNPVQKTPWTVAQSYGVGTCVFLDQPLESAFRIAMVSVTTQVKDVGLRADVADIFRATQSIHRLMANNRMTRLQIPVVGTGHGGIRNEVSLVCMLIALGELSRKISGHHLKTVQIIVFKDKENSTPAIAPITVKRALEFSSRFLGPHPTG